MDYDDNDFQSQNLQLAGEGSTKFPPVLRPYALPKFDFDESLQGNLRFDSLVETEVFLGIESNEDNQWIDAFSRGGSGIEFSSTAAESCSISRHGNVWSEATSSESVEMLLKSVGQEEYIPRQTDIQESDACDELACLAKQMDPNPKPDDKNEFKDNVTDLQPPGGICENLSGLKEDVGMEQSQDGVPQGHEAELSVDGSSGNLELNDICRNIDLPVSGGSPCLFTGDRSNDTDQREVETVAGESHSDKTQDDSSASGVQTNITEASMQHMGDEQQCPLQTETNKQDLESSMMNKDVVDAQTLDGNAVGGDLHHPDKSLCSIPTEKALEGGSVGEGLKTGVSSLEDSLDMEPVAVSDLQTAERCSEDVVLLKDAVMDDHSALKTCDSPKFSIKDDSVSEGQVVEDSNSNCEICPNLQQNVDVVEKKTCGENSVSKENELLKTGDHMDTEILSSKSESSIFTAEENNISTISEGNSDNRVGGFSSFILAASSTKSPNLGEPTQICENIEPDRQSDHEKFDQDVSVNYQDSKRIPSDSSQMHCDVNQSHLVDEGAGSLSVTAGSVETELTTSTVSINVMPVNNSDSQVISENISPASCEIIDIPPPSSKVVSTHQVTGHNDFQRTTPCGSSSIDEKEESAAKIAEKASISTSVGSSEQETAPWPVTGTEKHHSSDTFRLLLCETANDCLHNVGTSGTVKIGEPQGTLDDKVIQECTKEIGMPLDPHELTEKHGDGITVSLIKDDKETLQENIDNSSSKILGDDILLGNKGSISSARLPDSCVELQETGSFPANNTCSPSSTFGSPCQTEKDENEVKASASQNPPVSEFINSGAENILSTAQDLNENASKDERSLPPEVNPVADLSRKDVADVNTEDVSKRQSVPVAAANIASTVYIPVADLSRKDVVDVNTDVSKRQSVPVAAANIASTVYNPVADLSRKDVADVNTEDLSKRQSVPVAAANKASTVYNPVADLSRKDVADENTEDVSKRQSVPVVAANKASTVYNPVADLSRKDVADVNTEDVNKRQSVPVAAANKASTVYNPVADLSRKDVADENTDVSKRQSVPVAAANKASTVYNPVADLSRKDVADVNTEDVSKRQSVPVAASNKASIVYTPVTLSRKDVADVNTEDVSKRPSVPVAAANKASTAMEGSPSTSGLGPPKTKSAGNISHGSPQISDGEVTRSVSKATPERKTKRAYNKKAGKESSRKGSRVKETTPTRQPERGDKSTNVSLSPSPGFQMMQSNEVQQYGHIDSNSTKPFALVNASTSSLPDLNTSASPPVLFHQPFTDLQQVQLRAQIFVYGALIQGTAPDEAHMISAFGGPDGGRSIWENAWRACMERQHSQKSHPVNPETPLQSRSGARASDPAVKHSAVQGKAISSPLGRSSSKATPSTVNPLVPLSSPLWNLPTPSCDSLQSSAMARGSVVDYPQALTSLHHYHTPPLRNFLGHNTSWISQTPLRGPWIASPTPAPDNSVHPLASTVSDTTKLSSVKGSLPPSSGIKNVTPGLPASSAGLQSISVGTASLLDANDVIVSPSKHSLDPKPKKRKKAMVSEDLGQTALLSLTPVVSNHMSTSLAIPVGNVPITTVEKSVVSVSPLADHLKSDRIVEKRILSDESLMKVKEARVHAEEASAFSAAAVNHSLEIWNQLDKCKSSGLTSDIEAKLASAAVAVAAAAAVAKAAAAAANVASNAAIQAKLMADEALISSGYENSSQSNKISLSEGTSNLGKATPASILKGANGTNSPSSIIGAAKEAVRRRVEAASAATKRAENMDAIVKAAELAAEAVSQAGKIVIMGDPLPLSDLVEAGPEGFWKAAQESSHQVGLSKDMTRDLVNIDNVKDIPETSHTHIRDISSGVISTSININEKNSKGTKGRKISDLVKPVDVVPESEPEIQASSFTVSNGSQNLEDNNIKEGSLVEVFKDDEGFKAAWFTANILTLKDGKAYVCYTSLVAVEGAGPLKEWVSLEGEGDKPPRIRTTRPPTSLNYEGTRKRRRAAMADYAWSVGDRVDAWTQERWQEGVITEKNKKDETLAVHFPASGETSVVRAWHLRPCLIWKDGKWIEFSKLGANDSSTHEGDTPHEKRPKLGSPAVEIKGKDKMLKTIDAGESANPDEMGLLNLTENEKVFNIGKSIKNENKPDTHRMPRSGLQKEASRVIFGVPKPGKKRKFMEVSKHYVAHGSSKINDRNDSVKLANFLMPQGSGSRGWKNSSKIDSKEKLGTDSKPKLKNFKSGKPPTVLGRTIPPKDNSLSNAFSLTTDLTGHTERIKDSSNRFKNAPQNDSQVERAPHSATDGTTEGPILFSSLSTSKDALTTKKASTSRASKGKLAPAGGKLGKGEVEKAINDNPIKSTSDAIEPRRSNRKIQPTSRLLEGLQSSLIISKIPSFSHNRNPSKGNNQG